MARLQVLTLPDDRLRLVATPVVAVNGAVRKQLDDMLETMYADNGVGLAATQVNIHKRMIVIDLREDLPQAASSGVYKMINPEIIWSSPETTTNNEGCLSVPEYRVKVTRSACIRLHYLDENGDPQNIKAEGMLAVCIQHEIDHLNGKLCIDYLSPLKQKMALKRLAKLKRFYKTLPEEDTPDA
ncbi:MAG: peptide deformylase [Alphaproteobacteria bacterium]|nr:MAG: peptide deformylase [Alphaproteobacteria bacterium]